MNDNRNKKVSEEKSKKVTKGSRKISDAADNRIAESLKPYVEINKVASKIAKPYLATNNIVPKVGEAYSVLENLKTNRLGALPTVNTAWQKYLKQTEIPCNRFNSALRANTAWQKYLKQTEIPCNRFNSALRANTAWQKYLKQTEIPCNRFNSALRANTAWQTYLKQTEIPSNRFNSALGANTVWQEYLKRAENTANIFRNAIKPFKANNAFTKNYSQIVEVSDRFQKLVERTIGKHSENLKVAKLLMKNGWVTSEFFYNSVLRDNYDKTEKDVLEYVEKFYTENNYQKFFRVFDLVIEGFKDQGLNEGYRLTLVKIRKLLKQDFDNYDLFMNITFSIIEYLCSFKFGILSTNDYIKEKSIGTARKKYADKNGQLTKIDIMSMFGVLKSWWKKINFKKGLDRTDFGRSPIEHGRYDPRRYKRTDFIKLILFMFNVLMAPDPDVES